MKVRDFLHLVSFADGTCVQGPTSAELLRQHSFIDGRTDFFAGPPRQIALSEFVSTEGPPAPPTSYIFHLAFGGSTLISRLLDVPGHALALREPNCLAQLANHRASDDWRDTQAPEFAKVINAVRNHLGRRWADAERVVVKPSNWANNLLPELLGGMTARAVLFLVSSRVSFVRSVLRGGPDRIAFAARAAVHLSGADPAGARWVSEALAADDSAPDRLIRLACVLHAIQLEIFHATSARCALGVENWLNRDELAANAFAASRRAAQLLELDLPDAAIADNVKRWASTDAKDPGQSYSRAQEGAKDAALAVETDALIERALGWAVDTLGPDRSAAPA